MRDVARKTDDALRTPAGENLPGVRGPAGDADGPPVGSGRPAAFFDVDGTIIHTTIVHYFIYFKLQLLPGWRAKLWYPWFMAKCGGYLAIDKFNRTTLNRIVYRNYARLPVAPIKSAAFDCVRAIAEGKWLSGARKTIDDHRTAGRPIVLVTGSLDFLMEALGAELGGADVLAAKLEERDGAFTGELVGGPVIAEEKRRLMLEYAARHRIDLAKSYAYGDSSADLPMLEAVGYPHAVNPDKKLRSLAERKKWPVLNWPVNKSF